MLLGLLLTSVDSFTLDTEEAWSKLHVSTTSTRCCASTNPYAVGG